MLQDEQVSTPFTHSLPRPSAEVSMSYNFFFFQAEDGIRDYKVTGVQTCALPIYPETVDQAKHILIWGSNIITSNIHLWRYILKARSRGAKIVTIDPLRTKTGDQSDEHIPIMPGTDGALALAMMHIIIRDGLQDQDYVDRYTIGFEALKERVKEYPP